MVRAFTHEPTGLGDAEPMQQCRHKRCPVVLNIRLRAEDRLFLDPWGHENSGHAGTHEVIAESVVHVVRPRILSVRSGHMVEDTAVLVERNDQQGLLPVRSLPKRIVNLVELLLSRNQVRAGMIRRRSYAPDPNRFEEAERGKIAAQRVRVELVYGSDI